MADSFSRLLVFGGSPWHPLATVGQLCIPPATNPYVHIKYICKCRAVERSALPFLYIYSICTHLFIHKQGEMPPIFFIYVFALYSNVYIYIYIHIYIYIYIYPLFMAKCRLFFCMFLCCIVPLFMAKRRPFCKNMFLCCIVPLFMAKCRPFWFYMFLCCIVPLFMAKCRPFLFYMFLRCIVSFYSTSSNAAPVHLLLPT